MSSVTRTTLLGDDEPEAFDIAGGGGSSPFLIACDHAGRRLPRSLGSLGLSPAELQTHIAWDIGAGAVARRLGALLDAVVICQPYSRLVIDCNRPPGAPDSIVATSERTEIPGNRGIEPPEAELRARAVFHAYHDRIGDELDRREQLGRSSIFVAMHSFTPVFLDVARPWHVGVLFNRDARIAEVLLRLLRSETGLVVGCNEPYAASELTDYSLIRHGETRGIAAVELEVRQDLIAEEAGQAEWAERLARALAAAAGSLGM